MSTMTAPRLAVFLAVIDAAIASPIPTHFFKRELSAGARAGLGLGIAVAVILVALIITFFVVHLRRSIHNTAINNHRAVLAGEKNPDGSDKVDQFAPEQSSGMPRRNKSVKDRLMGPLYRGSMIDMPTVPRAYRGDNRRSMMNRDSTFSKPWSESGEQSPRPSFSSKRATRMMMMM